MFNKKLTRILLLVAGLLCLISGIGARFIATTGQTVKIYDVTIATDVGVLTGQVYVPASATATAKKPAVVLSHGYLNTGEMQDANAVELAKRNYVVFAMNMYNHGGSYLFDHINEIVDGPFVPLFAANAYGMYDAVEYLYNLPFVDNTKIGVAGHSLGGMSATQAVYLDDMWVKSQKDLGITVAPKIASVLLMGADANYTASAVLNSSNNPISPSFYGARHVGIIAGQYDEFFFSGVDYPAPRDYLKGANAHQFVNSVNVATPVAADTPVADALTDKVNGYYYGTVEYFGATSTKQYMRVIYNPEEIHPWNHFSFASTGAVIEFFFKATATTVTSFPTSFATSAGNQVWWIKVLFNFVGLVGFFMFVVPFAMLLMELPFFASLKATKEPELKSKPIGKVSNAIYWSIFGITIVLSLVTFLFVTQWINRAGEAGFPGVSAYLNSFFNQPTTNEFIAWAVVNAVIVVGLFVGGFFLNKKYGQPEQSPDLFASWGVKIKLCNIGKTLLLALAVMAVAFGLVFTVDYFFNTDFRIWTLAVKVFENYHLTAALKYLPFFALFFVASSFAINASLARKDRKEWLNILFAILANAGGVLLVVFIQYLGFRITGVRTFPNQNLRPILAFAFIPLLSISAVFARILYRKTGTIWLGAIINAMMITMITAANTATYLV
jgi:pimeloyl-ACP methyl ester carboxylesterase